MPDSGYLALFLVGLLGGTHCVGMCGGIVGALSFGGPPKISTLLAYNGGRIFSYTLAGVLVGGLGAASSVLAGQWPLRTVLFFLANLMLLAMGAYLLGLPGVLAVSERIGKQLWQRIQPYTRQFLPVRGVRQALPLGMLWGWLPCGLVYSALAMALAAGSAVEGGLVMLAFGLGTLPNLLLAGLFAVRLQKFARQARVRIVAGWLIIAFGLYGLWNMRHLLSQFFGASS